MILIIFALYLNPLSTFLFYNVSVKMSLENMILKYMSYKFLSLCIRNTVASLQ